MPDRPTGLTRAQAEQRLAEFGPNEPVSAHRLSAAVELVHLFANPLVVILLVASAISASLGQRTDALIIITIVLVGIAINFWQTYRSQRAADRLRASVAPTATVLRDGAVAGDPAANRGAGRSDSAVGRRSRPRGRAAGRGTRSVRPPVDADRRIAAGRQAASGHRTPSRPEPTTPHSSSWARRSSAARRPCWRWRPDRAPCSATSPSGSASRAPASEFEHGLRRFSLLILRTTIVLVLFILLVALALRRDPIESLLFAVALGVGLTPEFLPMIASDDAHRGRDSDGA